MGVLNMITKVITNGRGRQRRQNQRDGNTRRTLSPVASFKYEGRRLHVKNTGDF